MHASLCWTFFLGCPSPSSAGSYPTIPPILAKIHLEGHLSINHSWLSHWEWTLHPLTSRGMSVFLLWPFIFCLMWWLSVHFAYPVWKIIDSLSHSAAQYQLIKINILERKWTFSHSAKGSRHQFLFNSFLLLFFFPLPIPRLSTFKIGKLITEN